jgi:transporter family-2 protein
MKLPFLSFTLVLGVVLAVHLAMNSMVGSTLKNPRVSNAVFWCIGALAGLAISATAWRPGTLAALQRVHPVLFLAGALGASLVFGIIWLIPQVGARAVFIALIAGQVLGGMVLSQFGWLGSPVQKVSLVNGFGALVLIAGVLLATHS